MPTLCVIPGDGIGQEVIPAAVTILQATLPDLHIVEAEAGWDCFEKHGVSVPKETLAKLKECGTGLFGAVSSPSYKVTGYKSAILTLRQSLNLYASIRPIKSWPRVSPRPDIDMIIVRENSEGLYVGQERLEGSTAVAQRIITRQASQQIAQKTIELVSRLQRQTVTIVHKANVLPLSDGLFRDTVRHTIVETNPAIEINELLVDVAALKMVAEPDWFDVVVTTNLFGDILSDAAAHWGGGLGMVASLNWGDGLAIAEPVHGSAPDIAGQGVANPLAAVLSAALLARFVWQREAVAEQLETAVYQTLADEGYSKLNTTAAIQRAVLGNLE